MSYPPIYSRLGFCMLASGTFGSVLFLRSIFHLGHVTNQANQQSYLRAPSIISLSLV